MGLLPIVAVVLLLAGVAYAIMASSKVPGRGVGKGMRK